LVGGGGRLGAQVGVKVGSRAAVTVGVKVRDRVGDSVGELTEGMIGCKVGEFVGVNVNVGTWLVVLFASARESEKPPMIKPMEARAMRTPRNACREFFIADSLQATPLQPAS
jgi:hypothetical protein